MTDRLNLIPPSPPGPLFAGADVAEADIHSQNISQQQAGAIIQQAAPNGTIQNDNSGVIALLAAILKNQKRNNANFTPVPFGYNAWASQQVFGANPLRNYLLIQNVGSGDLMILFETRPITIQDFSAATTVLTTLQIRAVRVVAGGYYEPLVAPTNPITLFTLGTGTQGLAISGD